MSGTGESRWADVAALLTLLAIAAAYAWGVVYRRAQGNEGLPHFDTYAYVYPNVRYALDSLARGHGLLWNRLQNCGQPFFAITLTALLYPLHAIYLLLDFHRAIVLLFGAHLLIGAAGVYALARALEISPAAALFGAVAFELGAQTLWLGYWAPPMLAVYVWMPVALAAAERLLRAPRPGMTAALVAALAMQWLAGHPQVSLFTYQLIGLRLLWECVTAWRTGLWRGVVAILAALLLAPLLCAVQLVPSIELVEQSVRGRPLSLQELRPRLLDLPWATFRGTIGERRGYGALFTFATVLVMSLAWARRGVRRVALFYALATALYIALVFDNPIFDLYRRLPLGSTFREPYRFLWVAACTGCVVAAAGVDALTGEAGASRRRAAALFAAPLVAAVAFALLSSPIGLWPREWVLGGGVLALIAAALALRRRWLAPLGLVGILLWELLVWNGSPLLSYWRDDTVLQRQAAAFAAVRERATLQDRMYQVLPETSVGWGGMTDGIIKKAGQWFDVPSIVDYEPQASRRYAELLVQLLWGKPMHSLNQFYFDAMYLPRSRPLFDLLAARYVVIDARHMERKPWPSGPNFTLVWEGDGERVYENRGALPRAFYVSQATVMDDPAAVLATIATGTSAAVLEGSPPGVVGSPGGAGTATIIADDSEIVRVNVRASQAGFLILTDQDYPGWEASVNGLPAPIRRANYAFRAVAVPVGESLVEFRYRPLSLRLGAAGSAVTVVLLAAGLWWWHRRLRSARRRRPRSPTPRA